MIEVTSTLDISRAGRPLRVTLVGQVAERRSYRPSEPEVLAVSAVLCGEEIPLTRLERIVAARKLWNAFCLQLTTP